MATERHYILDELEKADGSITGLARVIHWWANIEFPDRIPEAALTKLVMEEIPELLEHRRKKGSDSIAGELADCFILLLDLAVIWGVNPDEAIKAKMRINVERRWNRDEATGFYNHVENEDAPAIEGSGPVDKGVRHEALDNRRSETRTDCRGAPLQSVGPGAVIVRFSDGWHTSQLVRTSGGWRMGTCTRCGRNLDGGFALPDQIHFGGAVARDIEEAARQGAV